MCRGRSGIVQALTLRLTGPWRVFTFGVAVGVVPFLQLLNPPPPAALAVLGACGLAAAVVLNHVSLTRSSTYKHTPPAFGVAQGLAPR